MQEYIEEQHGDISISTGMESLTDFLTKQYLEEYISHGGSKIKFVTGRQGSGKTLFGKTILSHGEDRGYLAVAFSAKDVWMHDFKEIYLEILRQCDIEHVLTGCAYQIILEMGYRPEEIKDGQNFMDYLSERGEADPLVRGEIRSFLREYFTRNPLLDHNFGYACSLITGGILGHPVLEESNREILLAFLNGDKTVKLSSLRTLGLSPSRVTKYNARNLLRSLAEVVHLAGYAGLLIMVDDLEILLNRSSGEQKRYTRLRREDAYESIRQLIDDIDGMRYIMFLFCFDRNLIDNINYGVKSYQALWMRIQNEVVSPRFNHFADIIDMDRYADEFYTKEVLYAMSEKIRSRCIRQGLSPIQLTMEDIEDIISRAEFGGIGIPGLIYRAVCETVCEKEEEHV